MIQPTSSFTPTLTNAQAQNILKKAPYTPTDVNLFRTQTYSNAVAYMPAAAPTSPVTATQLKSFVGTKMSQLYKTMNPALSSATASSQGQAAANLIDNESLKKYVPDVRLRAAVASLKGTAADGAVGVYQSGAFKSVTFANMDPGIIASSQKEADGTQTIKFNSRYQNEDPRLLATTLAHEALHTDGVLSLAEEKTAYELDAMVSGQFALADSTLPSQKTELTQRVNMKLMARMNDRDPNTGNLRTLIASGPNIFPGGTPAKNFDSIITANDPNNTLKSTTPGSAYLRSFLKNVTGKDLGTGVGFNDITLKTIDTSQSLFTLQQLIQINKNLKLNVPAS